MSTSAQQTAAVSPALAATGTRPLRLQRKCACEASDGPCARCGAKPGLAQRKANMPASEEVNVSPLVDRVLASPGVAMDAETRATMESRFAHDFSEVRLHSDAQASGSVREVGAVAYASGSHVVFGQGAFRPHEPRGGALLAHELAHVVQQRRGGGAMTSAGANASLEAEADSAAKRFAHGPFHIPVQGRAAPGLARATDMPEDDGVGGWISSKYRALKKKIPEKYREAAKQVVTQSADAMVSMVLAPVAPPILTRGIGADMAKATDALTEGNQKKATEHVKAIARDRLLDAVGGANGIVKQVTELADTAGWVGKENRALRKKIVDSAGGEKSAGGQFAKVAYHAVTNTLLPGTGLALDAAAEGADMIESAGAQKDEFGNASLTATYSKFADGLVKQIEEGVGGAPADPELITRAEKAELEMMIVSQVGLSLIGVEEVKIVMNAAGALSSVRGLVETMRHNKNWESDPKFWSHLIGGVLALVGLGSSMAKRKIIKQVLYLILKYGWGAAAIPPLADALKDYDEFLSGKINNEKFEARSKKHIAAAYNVLKDAVLHVSQSKGGAGAKRPGAGGEAELPGAKPNTGTAAEGPGTPPAIKAQRKAEVASAKAGPAGSGPENTLKPLHDPVPPQATDAAASAQPTAAKRKSALPLTPEVSNAAESDAMFKALGDELRTDTRDFKQQDPLELKPYSRPGADSGRASPLSIPKEGIEMPWVGEGKASSEKGYLRDSNGFWKKYAETWPDHLIPANKARAGKTLPVVDETWVKSHPEHAEYIGEPLEHHHVGQGGLAVPMPEKLHNAYTVFHPQRQVVGEPGQPLRPMKPLPTSRRQQAEIKRHIRQGRVKGPGVVKGEDPSVPGVPLASELAGQPADQLRAPTAASEAKGQAGKVLAGETDEFKAFKSMLREEGVTGTVRAEGDVVQLGEHGGATANRKELGVSGKQVQSAHGAPQSVMKGVPGYNPKHALTRLMDRDLHTGMDQFWKEAFQNMRRTGQTKASAQTVHDVVAQSIRQAPGLAAGEKASLIARLSDEMFVEAGLKPTDLLDLPYPNIKP